MKINKTIQFFCLAATLALAAGCTRKTEDKYSDWRNVNVDSLEQVLATKQLTDQELMNIHKNLSYGYMIYNFDKCTSHARKGLIYADRLNNPYTKVFLYKNLGVSYYIISKYDSAMIYLNKALAQLEIADWSSFDPTDVDNLKSTVYGSMANLYNKQDYNHEALKYYLMTLELLEKNHRQRNLMVLYNNVGQLYLHLNDYEEAEKYFLKTRALAQELNDSIFIASSFYFTAEIAMKHSDYSQALENATIAYEMKKADPDLYPPDDYSYSLTQLCEIYLKGYKDNAQAEKYALMALKNAETLEKSGPLVNSYRYLADVYLHKGMYRKSEEAALKAVKLDSIHYQNDPWLAYLLAKINMYLGNPEKATEYLDHYTDITTEHSQKNYQSALSEMQTKYETEKKELKIATLEREKRMMTWLSVAGGVILLLALTAFFLLWRWTIQKRRLAEMRIKQLEQEKQLIATQSLLDGEMAERSRLARDLHDGLGGLLTGVKMQLLEMKKGARLTYEDIVQFDKALGLVDNSVLEMRRVSHHLMPDSLSRFGLKSAVDDFCRGLSDRIVFDYFGDGTRQDTKLEVLIYRCIYELVNNALKHAGAGQIMVQIIQEPDRIAFTVQDDGCGFDPSAETKGTGLQNIRTRVASYNGILNIHSKEGEGTETNVELKIKN